MLVVERRGGERVMYLLASVAAREAGGISTSAR